MKVGTLMHESSGHHHRVCLCVGHIEHDTYVYLVYSSYSKTATIYEWAGLQYEPGWRVVSEL